jgi:putative acetyltransferase
MIGASGDRAPIEQQRDRAQVELVIALDDPRADDVQALLGRHLAFAHATSPREHVHALDTDALLAPEVSFFSARSAGALLGVGALKRLDATHAELKSMHTSQEARGQGVARALVLHLLATARELGFRRVSLETGTEPEFEPARRLYASTGFTPCGPFAQYTDNAYSYLMTIELDAPGAE